MSWKPCPVCSQNNPSNSMRCSSCGADFSDPDVMAMMGEDVSNIVAPEVAAGSLAHGKVLGFSEQGLISGSSVRRLALVGAIFLVAAFLVPVSIDFDERVLVWKALDSAPAIALLFPALAALMGLVAFIAPLHAWQRSATLVSAGVIGIATLPFLGGLSGSPEKLLPLIWLGTLIGGWGLLLRCYDAQSDLARKVIIGGAVIAIAGFFLPISDPQKAVPLELRFYFRESMDSASAFTAYKTVFNRDPTVYFSTVYLFMPIVLLPLAATLSWAKPTGAWDKSGMFLRPLAWLAVLYVPLGFALFAFNLLGENDGRVVIERTMHAWNDVTSHALLGRLRLLALGAVFALWASMPIITLLRHFAPKADTSP